MVYLCGKDIPFHIEGEMGISKEPKKQNSFWVGLLFTRYPEIVGTGSQKIQKAINKLLVVFLFTIQIIIFQNSNYLGSKYRGVTLQI